MSTTRYDWRERYNEHKRNLHRVYAILEKIAEYVEWQIDYTATDDTSTPEDMTAHVNGLVYQWAHEAMELLRPGNGTRQREAIEE